jgi:hypothetical protein
LTASGAAALIGDVNGRVLASLRVIVLAIVVTSFFMPPCAFARVPLARVSAATEARTTTTTHERELTTGNASDWDVTVRRLQAATIALPAVDVAVVILAPRSPRAPSATVAHVSNRHALLTHDARGPPQLA